MKKLIAVSTLVTILLSCSSAPVTGRKQLQLISGDQLSAMGKQSFNEILKVTPPVDDREISEYVRCVADPVIATTIRRYNDAPREWKIVVLQDSTPNAFAMPGGYIGVHLGMLEVAESDSQLAAVIGHEVGHLLADHAGERVSQQLVAMGGLALTDEFLLGNMNTEGRALVMTALGAGTQLGVLLPYGRTQESEADVIGVRLMANAGFDPQQSIGLWENMRKSAGSGGSPEFLSTHPAPESRIKRLEAQMPVANEEYQSALRAANRKPASSLCRRPSKEVIDNALKMSIRRR